MPKTAIVILNYNHAEDTRRCIESILRYNTAQVKFVVSDNGSEPAEREAMRKALGDTFGRQLEYVDAEDTPPSRKLDDITLIETGDNLGYACGNNAALRYVYQDDEINTVMILNNDILFVEDIIPGLIETKRRLADCAIISPVLYRRDMDGYDLNCARRNETVGQMIMSNMLTYVWALLRVDKSKIFTDRYMLSQDVQPDQTVKIELPSGSCMLVDKALFEGIGSFDPNTFLFYEENILFKKIQRANLSNYLSTGHRCIHLGSSTISKQRHNSWLVRKSLDSRKYYVYNYSGASVFAKAAFALSDMFFRFTIRLRNLVAKK